MLELHEVDTHYGRLHILHGVSILVEDGEIVTLVGANGAGKTTLLMSISGFVVPSRGSILFGGQNITGVKPSGVVHMGISQVAAGRRLFPLMTVSENLAMGAYLRKDKETITRDLAEIYGLFPILKERRRQLAGTLSGGEQQMLAIGRALMSEPKLLLMDEPSFGLAPKMVEAIASIIRQISLRGVTILLVEQNVQVALQLAHRGYVLELGQITIKGTGKELLNNEKVKTAYLGL